MVYAAAGKKKTYLAILATVVVLAIFAQPCSSSAEPLIHTVQLGSYLSEEGANKHFDSVVQKLNQEDRGSLRIEKVGKFYALRLGVIENSEAEAKRFFRKINAVDPGAIMLTVNSGKNRFVRIANPEAVESLLVSQVETVDTPVEESVVAGEVLFALPEPEPVPEPPAEVRATLTNIVQPVILKPQNVRVPAPVAVQESEPLIPDSLLIGFATIITLFMLEYYIRTLSRLGTFESLKWLLAGTAATEWIVEQKYIELPEVGEELQVVFATGPMTPVSYFAGNDSVLTDESHERLKDVVVKNEPEEIYLAIDRHDPADLPDNVWVAEYGEFDLDEGRICPDEEVLFVAEESAEIKLEVPEHQNLHTVVPRTIPRKRQTGGGADNKIGRSEKTERENRVDRAVLAVSFFADES